MLIYLKYLIIFIIIIYIVYGSFLYFIQDKIIFYPVEYNSEEIKIIENTYKNFKFHSIHINTLKITYWENIIQTKNTILFYFGGNAENTNYTIMELSEHTPLLQYKWILINYPGYNGSNGIPSEKNFYIYGDVLINFFLDNGKYNQIVIMGRSIGTGVAVYLANKLKINKLILITPFDSIESLAKRYYPFLPASLFLKHKFPSVDYIKNLNIPILILAAEYDEIIPQDLTEKLVKSISHGHYRYYVIPGTSHNTISESPDYWKYIQDFLNE